MKEERATVADYRFSVQIIKRSEGKSSIASAAYRSASRLDDLRTGEIHDYGRKDGVTHCEIITPDNCPEWMHDRAQLWNAVEAVERRNDAQLAREIQLSLPHELTDDQRLELVRGFVQEQFVNQGMIADIALHSPSDKGDERNYHAHVMLTMRELTGDGFGKKNRDWNSPDNLTNWREEWAHHQNRELERHGHQARVDHRSFADQGVDREPTQHLGPIAHDMEAKGKGTRIGDENRERNKRNSERAQDHVSAAVVASQKARFENWAQVTGAELGATQDLTRLDLTQKHDTQSQTLERKMQEQFGTAKKTMQVEVNALDRRLAAKGVRRVLRDVFGRTRDDKTAREAAGASLADIRGREDEQRQLLKVEQERQNEALKKREDERKERLTRGVESARARREATNWTNKRSSKPTQAANAFQQAKTQPTPTKTTQPSTEPKSELSEKVSLADQKTTPDIHLREAKSLSKPWTRQSIKPVGNKPWTREGGGGLKRKPKSPKGEPS